MRNFLFVSLLLISNVLFAQQSGFIKDRPFSPHVVNDYGSFLSSGDERSLENELISFRQKKGYSIVIITLSTLTDNSGYTWSVEDAALRYFNKWGIGSKRSNDGVLILLSKDPRRVRIATGSGVDAKLTDEVCQRIIDNTILPEFKRGWYYTGLKEGVKDIESALTGFTSSGGTHNANTLHSGNTAPAADNWTTVEAPEQPQARSQAQPQPLAQNTSPYTYTSQRRPPTVGETILSFLMLALFVWLRVRYIRSKGRSAGSNFADYMNATGYVFLWFLKIFWWTLVCCFGIFAIFFGINVWKGRGASASFGGGKSSGGGATGSW